MPDVIFSNEITNSISRVLKSTSELKMSNYNLVLSPLNVVVHTRLQTIFDYSFERKIDNIIHDIIMTHALSAEKLGPGSFELCIEKLHEGFVKYMNGNHKSTSWDDSITLHDAPKHYTSSNPKHEDVDWLINKYFVNNDQLSIDMLKQAIDLAGFNGNIIIERASSLVPNVEATRGYNFNLAPMFPVQLNLDNPRIFCIDGFIESVSEIHHLLETASDTKDSVLIFARGMSDDVLHTLKVNFNRGSLRVIPFKVNFDLESVNVLADICAVTNNILISTHKGDLISSIKYEQASHVKKVNISKNRIIIHEPSTHQAVTWHINKLRDKRASLEHDDVIRIYDERLRSLTPNHVSLRLPDDRFFVQRSQSIDYVLRAFRSLLTHGTIEHQKQKFLTSTILAAQVHSRKCLKTLLELGAVFTS